MKYTVKASGKRRYVLITEVVDESELIVGGSWLKIGVKGMPKTEFVKFLLHLLEKLVSK